MFMVLEEDDKRFQALLQQKMHKELLDSLSGISAILSKHGQISDIEKAIKESAKASSDSISLIAKAISEMPKPDAPSVNVVNNNEEILASIQAVCNEIIESNNQVIKALSEPPKPVEAKIIRDSQGYMISVKFVYKN